MNINNATPLISVTTGAYPLYLPQVRALEIDKSFAEFPTEDTLAELGYAVVHSTQAPTADVVTEDSPALRSGRWEQQWLARDFTTAERIAKFSELKQIQLEAIRQLRISTLEKGFNYTFPDNTTGHVQLRDGDRANLNAVRTRADQLRAAGGPPSQFFRTYENVWKGPLTPDQAIVLTDIAYDKYMLVLQICGQLSDQTEAATTVAAFPAVPADLSAFGID